MKSLVIRSQKVCAVFAVFLVSSAMLRAAPIPGLYSTGVDDTGAVLGASTVDPHYTLVQSPDAVAAGPETYTLAPGFPVGPWLAEGPDSRWIAPQADQSVGTAFGDYIYQTTFDLTGFDPATAKIFGKWTSDNGGLDIILNGESLFITQGGDFTAFTDFEIDSGFIAGENVLEFVINNAGEAANPTGLRVALHGTVEVPGEAPYIITQPEGAIVLADSDVFLSVVADGTSPLQYEWKKDGQPVPGGDSDLLELFFVTSLDSGSYTVTVSNGFGSVTSEPAVVSVYEPIPGLYGTGLDDNGLLLWDYDPDPHYVLAVNPDSESTEPIVEDTLLFPIVEGPWVGFNNFSLWIGPSGETSAAAAGEYVYELTFDLTGLDPTQAFIEGLWTSDNEGQIWLNDAPTGISHGGNFDQFFAFRIESGFLTGENVLQFKVNNGAIGYTGLRVQDIIGGAAKKTGPGLEPPRVVAAPQDKIAVVGDTITFTVLADGTAPISYQWQFNGEDLPGETSTSLILPAVQLDQEGTYKVILTNAYGEVESDAELAVFELVPGLFNTGVDDQGAPLEDGAIDPHYELITNPQVPESTDAIVEDTTVWPIVEGPWLLPNDMSKWIGPTLDPNATAGDFTYRATFDLTGFDHATAFVQGGWATDNIGVDIVVNGVSTGIRNEAGFSAFNPFLVSTGFQPGINTIDFVVNNANTALNPTGLRIEGIRAVAKRGGEEPPPVLNIMRVGNQVKLSWPAAAAGYSLYKKTELSAPDWTAVTEPIVVEDDMNTVSVEAQEGVQFFQLQK